MAESTSTAQCSAAEFAAAQVAGLHDATPGTNAFDAAVHRFADLIRAQSAATLADALFVLRMVNDNHRVDAGEERKAWRHDFVVSEVRRVLGAAQ